MDLQSSTRQQLLREIDRLQNRLSEAEDTLEAIHSGKIDAVVVSKKKNEQIFVLQSVDYSYRIMVENINEGAVVLNKNGVVVFSNRAFAAMTGRKMSLIVGAHFKELLPKTLQGDFTIFLKKTVNCPCRREFAITRNHGGPIPISISATIFKAGSAQNLCMVVADLSEQKQAEKKLLAAYEEVEKKVQERTLQLRKAGEELQKSEARFRLAIKATQDAIWDIDIPSGTIHWSETYEKAFGRPKTTNSSWQWWIEHIHAEDRDRTASGLRAAIDGKKNIWTCEYRFLRVDGTWADIYDRAHISRDESGKAQRVVGAMMDITERKRLEEDLKRHVEELAAANKELESFSYSISHDLRAPLRIMKSFSGILLEDHARELNAEGKNLLQRIEMSADKMESLIDDMLDLSKISRQEMVTSEIDLGAIAQSIFQSLRQTEPQRNIEAVAREQMKARGDERMMHIALSNLIGNAWKYSSKTPNARIEFGSMKKDSEWIYFVRDNGSGFDMKLAHKLFAPFQRLHSDSQFPGTGIGLAIVNRVIKRHGGRVWAESEVGKGSTFYFSLAK